MIFSHFELAENWKDCGMNVSSVNGGRGWKLNEEVSA